MKKVICGFIIFLLLCVIDINVYAGDIDESDLQISCIYGDGKVIVRSYDNFLSKSNKNTVQ